MQARGVGCAKVFWCCSGIDSDGVLEAFFAYSLLLAVAS